MSDEATKGAKSRDDQERVPTYGILIINHAYNDGKITFQEWMRLSHEWALKIKEQYGRAA